MTAVDGTPLCRFEVYGRPATFATAGEAAWKQAVREAVAASGVVAPADGLFAVRVAFRTAPPRRAGEAWDLDNLLKPTLDAMEGVFGLRAWAGVPQPNDDRVVQLEASKATVIEGEEQGASVTVWLV